MSKDMERYYLTPEFYDVLHSESPFSDVLSLENNDIKINGKPIIEYILSNVFPSVNISGGDYATKFSAALRLEHFRAEAKFCLEYAQKLIQKVRLPAGTLVQFVDENPFLGGQNNAYGKLIMEKCCKDISYTNERDLVYDIYLAGETLRTLYINFPEEIANKAYSDCKSYFDIINLTRAKPFDRLCAERSCNLMTVDRNVFFQVYADKQYDWIRDELKVPNIFNRIFTDNHELIKSSAENNAKVSTLRKYMSKLAKKDKKHRELFENQIEAEFRLYPYSDVVLNFADQVYRLVELRAIDMEADKVVLRRPVAKITSAEFSNREPLVVYRYADRNSPETKAFSFDRSNLGVNIIRSLFTKFLGLHENTTNQLLENVVAYEQAEATYGLISKYIVRRKLATSTMAALDIWANRNRDELEKYANKKIIYDYQMNFLGGEANFFGKAFERIIKNADAITAVSPGPMTPVYNPHSPDYNPVYNPHSPVYNPHSPVYKPKSPVYNPRSPVYKPKSPVYQTKLSNGIREWIGGTMENIRSTLHELSRISPDTNPEFFSDVFFGEFHSLLRISKKDRKRIARGTGYEARESIEQMLLENNIVDIIEMFPGSVVDEFDRLQKEGRKLLSKSFHDVFFWETLSSVAKYVACLTRLPEEDVYHFATSMVLNFFGDRGNVEKHIKKTFSAVVSGGVLAEKTTNRINFWNSVVKSIDNPTNIDTLIVKIREVIRYPDEDTEKAISKKVHRLIDEYKGDKTELLKILLDVRDYTTYHAVTYITSHKGQYKSLEDQAYSSGLGRFMEKDFAEARDADDVKKLMIFYGAFDKEGMNRIIRDFENILRKSIGNDGVEELRQYVVNSH